MPNSEEMKERAAEWYLEKIGDGNVINGMIILSGLASRLPYARQKHSWRGKGKENALNAIQGEFHELEHAIEHESHARQIDEAYDVLATVCRFILGEYKGVEDGNAGD